MPLLVPVAGSSGFVSVVVVVVTRAVLMVAVVSSVVTSAGLVGAVGSTVVTRAVLVVAVVAVVSLAEVEGSLAGARVARKSRAHCGKRGMWTDLTTPISAHSRRTSSCQQHIDHIETLQDLHILISKLVGTGQVTLQRHIRIPILSRP
jgi:hypothetical protein